MIRMTSPFARYQFFWFVPSVFGSQSTRSPLIQRSVVRKHAAESAPLAPETSAFTYPSRGAAELSRAIADAGDSLTSVV
jgi:hypothetical protein